MRNYFLLLGIALLIPHVSFTQSPNQSLKKKAEDADEKGHFEMALSYSQAILQGDAPDSVRYPFLLIAGKAALQSRRLEMAEKYLVEAKTLKPDDRTIDYYLAQLAHMHGDYDRAESLYRVAQTPEGSGISVAQLLNECEGDRDRSAEKNASVRISLSERFSKANAADFAGTFYDNDFYYVSHTPKELDEDCNCDEFSNCEGKLQLFSAGLDDETSTEITDWGNNIGQVSFSRDGQSMYFTQCDCQNEVYTCRIYYRALVNGAWGKPILLPKEINQKNTVSTQPYLAFDPVSEQEWLYFATNRREGKDLDIWKAAISVNQGDIAVEHMGPVADVNTEFDEVTPFFHTRSNTLYFSSNRPEGLGLGDFDVYAYRYPGEASTAPFQEGVELLKVIHEAAPLNSAYDDLYFQLNPTGSKAFLSSDRQGADRCALSRCLDIFEVDIFRTIGVTLVFSCTGAEFDQTTTNGLLQGTSVQLIGEKDPARAFPVEIAPDLSSYLFKELYPDDDYQLKVTNPDFGDGSTQYFSLSAGVKDTVINLNKTPVITWKIFTRDTNFISKHIDAGPLTLIREGRADSLVYLVPGTDYYEINLLTNSEYAVLIDSDPIQSGECENLAFKTSDPVRKIKTACDSGVFPDTFYFKVNEINGLRLYFDNDTPRASDVSSYDELFEKYLHPTRTKEFYAVCDGNSMMSFFQGPVIKNYEVLEGFGCYLNYMLEENDNIAGVDISISGFASRSGGNAYNTLLSGRRIESLIKFLQNKVGANRSKIQYTKEPQGIIGSSDPGVYPCSTYSLNASNDRRIVINNLYFKLKDSN